VSQLERLVRENKSACVRLARLPDPSRGWTHLTGQAAPHTSQSPEPQEHRRGKRRAAGEELTSARG